MLNSKRKKTMKTNLKTSISFSISGDFSYPDSCGSLSLFDSLDLYSSWKSSYFSESFTVGAPTIKVMLSRVFNRNSCLLPRLSSVSRLCSTFFSNEVYYVHKKKILVNVDYMYSSYFIDIPFIHFYEFFESFYCSRTSARILDTLNYYALKYPHVK